MQLLSSLAKRISSFASVFAAFKPLLDPPA